MRQDNKQLSARSNETINVFKLKESKAGFFFEIAECDVSRRRALMFERKERKLGGKNSVCVGQYGV